MLDLLGGREWPVSQLLAKVGISKANLSQQLAVLKSAGIVRTRREGRMIYCSAAIPEVKSVCQLTRNVSRIQIRKDQKLTA
jgi:ArsR family transcriptional regulator